MAMQLREQVADIGIERTAKRLVERLRAPEPTLSPDGFSLREAWEAFVGPLGSTMPAVQRAGGLYVCPERVLEEVRSGAFLHVTSNVVIARLQAAYAEQPSILDQLVSPYPSANREERMAGLSAVDGPIDVKEGDEYPAGDMTDRATQGPEPAKRGRMIQVTEEAVKFDKTGQLLARAASVGKKIKIDREQRGMNAIQDATGYKAFYPMVDGAATQTDMYRTSAAGAAWYNKAVTKTGTNALVDWTDIEVAYLLLAAMVDEKDEYIGITPTHLVVPIALAGKATAIAHAIETRAATASLANITISRNAYLAALGLANITVLSSYYLDAQSADTWYLGDFKSQFHEQVIIKAGVKEIGAEPKRDIVAGYIGRYKSRVFAVDDKFVIQCPGS